MTNYSGHGARLATFSIFLAVLVGIFITGTSTTRADAPAPMPLIDMGAPDAAKQLKPNFGAPVFSVDKSGIKVQLPAARGNYAGIQVTPASGDVWDLSPYGHIEAKVTNTGAYLIRFTLTVNGFFAGAPGANAEVIGLKPGESKAINVIFGYAFGHHPAAKIEPSRIRQLVLYVDKSTNDQSFLVEDLQAAGVSGEAPPFNPNDALTVPPNGVILGAGATFDPAKQAVSKGGKVSAGPDGALAVDFSGGTEESVTIKPAMGMWNLNQANEIRVKFKNIGSTAATPTVAIGSSKVAAATPIAPGTEAEVAASFAPQLTGVCILNPKGEESFAPGTGTTFASDKTKDFSIISDSTPGAKNLLVTSIVADVAVDADLPEWLGKRPPVEGDWTQTFDEEFNGPTIDTSKWNYYGHNYWDKRTHFSKDNLVLKNGTAILHMEKKHGFHNDDPNDTAGQIKESDYACGFLNTFGKWTQRYGYFESRMKLPTAPGMWPAFWLMPDRGKGVGHYRVGTGKQAEDTGVGGMEFDIMEFLSGWGPYRYNIAMIWDGYGKDKKSTGSEHNYVRPDKDGFITSGLLWTPGSAIYYCNGKEVLRWENPRVSDLQEYIMYDMVTGGWDNTPFDEAKLPADFTIDYCRVWQRKDLATPADGPKENKGDPSETKN